MNTSVNRFLSLGLAGLILTSLVSSAFAQDPNYYGERRHERHEENDYQRNLRRQYEEVQRQYDLKARANGGHLSHHDQKDYEKQINHIRQEGLQIP